MKRKLLSIAISLVMICSIFTGFTVNSEITDNSNQTFAVKYIDPNRAIFSNKTDTVKYGDSFTTTVSCSDYKEITTIAVTMGKDKYIEPTVNPDGSCVINIPFVTGNITIGVTLDGKDPMHMMDGNGSVASITTSLDHLTFYKQYGTNKYLIEENVEEFSCAPYDLVVIPEEGYEIDTLKVIYTYKNLKTGEYTKEEKPLEKMDDGSYVLSHGYHYGNMHLEGVVKPVETETSTITTEPQPTAPKDIKVTRVILSADGASIDIGQTLTLKAVVAPKNATNKKLAWSSSNKNIVTVNNNGVIKGIGKGTANIYAKATDGSKKYAKCTVTSGVHVHTAFGYLTHITVNAGSQRKWDTPLGGKLASYTSSNKKVATVNSNSVIKGIRKGKAVITIKCVCGGTAKCTVTVKQPVTRVKLSLTKKTLKAKQSCRIMAVAYPSYANNRYVKWTTSNKRVAYVTKSKTKSNTWNYIKAKKKGTAVIKAIAVDGSKKSASCKVTVKK